LLIFIQYYRVPAQRLQAEPQILDTLKRFPDYLPASMVVGLIHEQQGRFPEARQVYEGILARYAEFAPARKQLAALYTDHVGDQAKALDYATKAREALQSDPELAKTLGKIAYRRKDYRSATRFLTESVGKLTGDAEALYFLGMAHYSLKEKDASKRALTQALALNANAPFSADARKTLAELEKM